MRKKIDVKVQQYEKRDSFEAAFVARASTTVDSEVNRCIKVLSGSAAPKEWSDVLVRVREDLESSAVDGRSARISITPFIAEELARLDDHQVPRYLFHRYRYDVYPSERTLDEFPPYLQIEPTSICNFRCVFCYQTDESFSSRESQHMGTMPLEMFRRIVDQVEGKVEFVSLASRGEPLMCRELPSMLEFASGKFLNLKVNTNASVLTEDRAHALLSNAVDTVVFSADAAEEPLYSQLRVNGNLERTVRNIERFEKIRSHHYPSSKLISRVSGVYVSDDQEMEGMIRLWGGLVDQISFVRYNPWENVYEAPFSDVTSPCSDLWRRMFVWFDGRVNPCDTDYKSSLSVGNLNDETVAHIWRGDAYEQLREAHENRGRSRVHPCNRCVVV